MGVQTPSGSTRAFYLPVLGVSPCKSVNRQEVYGEGSGGGGVSFFLLCVYFLDPTTSGNILSHWCLHPRTCAYAVFHGKRLFAYN